MQTGDGRVCGSLYRFYLVTFKCYRNRALNGIYRQDQTATSVVASQNSFEPVQCTATNPDPLTKFQERMRCNRERVIKDTPYTLQLFLRDWCSIAAIAQKPYDAAVFEQHAAEVGRGIGMSKDVARKKWKLNDFETVTPAVPSPQYREKELDACGSQLVGNFLFVSGANVNRVPVRRIRWKR